MNFQELKHIEDYKFYLDLAFRRAREKGEQLRGTKLKGGSFEKSRYVVLLKMSVISDTLYARMEAIVKNYPSFDDLPEFYKELVKLTVDYGQMKKSLAALNWLGKKAREFYRIFKSKQMKNKEFKRINEIQREFLGRISSLVKQVKSDFAFLEDCRRRLKVLPVVKTGLRTVAIAGFPNVGKTTLMYKISGSKGEINSYPFTTKGVNVSYIGKGKERIQLLDTPGTLNRFEKMNNIEKVAYLAIKHCASEIVYVFDPTEEYPMEKQVKLYEKLKNDFGKEIIVYFSKADVMDKKELAEFTSKYKDVFTDAVKLRQVVEK